MEIKNTSMAERVFEEIESCILSGKYQKGDVLTEMKLSEEYRVSRTPIREALKKLEQENLIKLGGKGIVVLGVSREELDDIYEIRMRIEGLCARRAAQRITDTELERIYEVLCLQEFYTEKNVPDMIKNADSDFHRIIYSSSGSDTLYSILMTLHKKTQMYRKMSLEEPERARSAVLEHKAIYEALLAKDPESAEKLTIVHIKNAKNHLTSIMFGTEE